MKQSRLTGACVVMIVGGSLVAYAQTGVKPATADQRITALERKVADLEERLARLEGSSSKTSLNQGVPKGKLDPSDASNWRGLKKGMTTEQIRSVFGEPRKVTAGTLTYWYYSKGETDGYVIFHGDTEKVYGWQEPD